MPIRGPHIAPGLRLRIGGDTLAAARAVDTRLVKDRLARFEHQHRRYVGAQEAVVATGRRLRAARARLAACDAVLRTAIEALAAAVYVDGQKRQRNMFAAFGLLPPSQLSRRPLMEKVETVRRLVEAVRRKMPTGRWTERAARTADDAASAVAQAFGRVAAIETRLRSARAMRDAMRPGWHAAYAALKYAALAAGDDGAPEIHATLFAPTARTRTRRRMQKRAVKPAVPSSPTG